MDQADRYYQLSLLGRDAFLRSVADAALVRRRGGEGTGRSRGQLNENLTEEDTLIAGLAGRSPSGSGVTGDLEIYPLAKKAGAPFADRITVGRTANNDVVLKDITVSRFHVYFRHRDQQWTVCDAGSKNGTSLDGAPMEPRKELDLISGARLRIGDLETTFYLAPALFDLLQKP